MLGLLSEVSALPPQDINTPTGAYLQSSSLKGHSVFVAEYTTAQSILKILDPAAGYKIRIVFVVVSTGSSGDVLLWLDNDGLTLPAPFFAMDNSATTGAAMGVEHWLQGTIDFNVYLTCPADTHIIIYYDEI